MRDTGEGQSNFFRRGVNGWPATMWKTLTLVLLCIGLATSDLSPYKPRGWRPNGQRFNPTGNRLHAYYGPPGLPAYDPPTSTYGSPDFTTVAPTTTTTVKTTTTTPRSREPTTPSSAPEEDFEGNPALAIANSFAFNRPVYIYNAFPFVPGHVLV